MNPDHLEVLVEKADGDQGVLIALMEEAQAKYGYLPEDRLRTIAKETGRSLVDVYGATVGIVGFGGIGRRYAERARGFGMRILAVDIQGGDKPDYVEALWEIDRLD